MGPPTLLVPGGNITQYQCLAFGTGWCYQLVLKCHLWVTSNAKYLSSYHDCCVGEMVREVRTRQEVAGSNRCGPLPGLIYFFNQKYFGMWWSLHLVLSGLGAGSLTRVLGYRFKNWYLKTLPTNAYIASFLVVVMEPYVMLITSASKPSTGWG
jgi:hypothetical protein